MSAVEEVRNIAWFEKDSKELAQRQTEELDRLRAEAERLRQELSSTFAALDACDTARIAAEAALENMTRAYERCDAELRQVREVLATARNNALEEAIVGFAAMPAGAIYSATQVVLCLRALAEKEQT